jgi:hypothetical protein
VDGPKPVERVDDVIVGQAVVLRELERVLQLCFGLLEPMLPQVDVPKVGDDGMLQTSRRKEIDQREVRCSSCNGSEGRGRRFSGLRTWSVTFLPSLMKSNASVNAFSASARPSSPANERGQAPNGTT